MDEKKYCLRCLSGVIDNNVMYIYNNSLYLIMKYDLTDFSYEVIGQVQNLTSHINSVVSMIKYKENLFFIMLRRLCIIRFDIVNRSLEEYAFNDSLLFPDELTWKSFMHKSQIWMFSVCAVREIFIFDCHTGVFRKYHSMVRLFARKNIRIESKCELSNLYQIDHKIWGAVCGTTYIFSFDMSGMDISIYSLDCEGINSFDYDESDFWITVCDSCQIIKWAPDSGIIDLYRIDNMNFGNYPNCYICGYKNNILVVLNSDKDFYLINKETKRYDILPFAGRYQRLGKNNEMALFGGYLRRYNKLVLLPYDIDKIVEINLDDRSIRYKEATLKRSDYEQIYITNKLITDIVEEDSLYRLIDYIKYVKQDGRNSKNVADKEKIGIKIFEECVNTGL